MAPGVPRRRRRVIVRWSLWLLLWGLGIWVAAHLVPDLRLAGSPGEQVLTAASVAAVSGALLVPTLIGLGRVSARVRRRAYERLDGDDLDDWTVPVFVFAPVALALALNLVLVLALAPLALRVATIVARVGGLPVEPVEWWSAAVAAMLARSSAGIPRWLRAWSTGRRRLRRTVADLAAGVSLVGGLGLAELLLPGVRLEPAADPGSTVLVLVAVAVLYSHFDFELRLPFLVTVLRLAIAGVVLWVVSGLSTRLVSTLHIVGFWTFVLAAAVVVVATGIGALVRLLLLGRAQQRDHAAEALHLHQMAMDSMDSMSARPPLY